MAWASTIWNATRASSRPRSEMMASRECSRARPPSKKSCASRARTDLSLAQSRSMGAFEYTALDNAGRSRKGVIEGDTARHVRSLLREKQLLPVTIEAVADETSRKKGGARFSLRRGVSAADLSLMTRQLSTLARAGLPLEEALLAVSEQTERPRVQSIVLGVRAKVVEGHTLANGLDEFPSVFPEIYRATVSAGEQSG